MTKGSLWAPADIQKTKQKERKREGRALPLRFGHTSWAASAGSACSCSSWRAPAGSPDCWAGWPAAGCLQDRCPGSGLCSRGPSFPVSSCAACNKPSVTVQPSTSEQVHKLCFSFLHRWACWRSFVRWDHESPWWPQEAWPFPPQESKCPARWEIKTFTQQLSNVQEAVCKVDQHYLVDRSEHSVTQQLHRPELRGLQDSSVDLGPLLSGVQRLNALKADRRQSQNQTKGEQRATESYSGWPLPVPCIAS